MDGRLELINEVDEITNKLEEAKALSWLIEEHYFGSGSLRSDAEILAFAGKYNTLQCLCHLVADMLWDCCEKYRVATK
jgi:hypothetical protein